MKFPDTEYNGSLW